MGMSGKNSFVLYKDFNSTVSEMPRELVGDLFKAVFQYQDNGTVPEVPPELTFLLKTLISQFDRDNKKYEKTREKNRENARKRWDAIASGGMQADAKHADSDSDSDSDSGSDNGSDTSCTPSESEAKKKSTSAPESKQKGTGSAGKKMVRPKSDEVAAYMAEWSSGRSDIDSLSEVQSQAESERFCDHFESNGWRVGGKAAMRDWKSSVRNWLRSPLRANNSTKKKRNVGI